MTHRLIARLLCDYANQEIDRLIDEMTMHDAFCNDESTRIKLSKAVLEAYGEKGLCHALTHCIADAIVNSTLEVHISSIRHVGVENLYNAIRRFIAEKSLSLLHDLVRPIGSLGLIEKLRSRLLKYASCLMLYALLDVRGFSRRLKRRGLDVNVIDGVIKRAFEDCMASLKGIDDYGAGAGI